MQNYLDLLSDIIHNGTVKEDRTGIGTRSVFGRTLRFDLSEGFPLVTTRNISFRIAFEEIMFFLRGESNTKKLEEKNIFIWKDNTTREFLDSRGLFNVQEGFMGRGYGVQWRNYRGADNQSVDQIARLLHGLKSDPDSRRHLVTAWNPVELDEMALPPCHIMHQYQVMNGKLNSSFYMRSTDTYLGLPYNIAGYAFLNILFSKCLGLEPGELVYMGGDVHLYENQIENAKLQIQRMPYSLPTLTFNRTPTVNNLYTMQYEDVHLQGYKHYPPLPKVKMAV